ncbi:MFS transporter [Pseudomonas sp. MAFF 302030]|uniref:MFS transporter n=1 Tax=Pseudomonas morbosilactucae TaxID=2938197 RepID=A0A9X2C6F8_9PSED|nr:MFS transporter [Pseudomonas morbosilactucae]MCK9798084.1 MFS transporter [Pseudomonas morbosilactucae]
MLNVRSGVFLRMLLISAMALPMLVFYAVGALAPFLVADALVPPGALGYLTLSAFGFAAILSLWAGALVNHLGSRRSLVLLFFSSALAYGLMATVPGFLGLVLGLAVCGIAQALANPATNLLILERVPAQHKAAVVGLKQAGVQLSALVAGLLLPCVAQWLGWRVALLLMVPLALWLALTVPWVATRSVANSTPMRFALRRPNRLLSLLMAVQLCTGVALSSFVTFLGLFSTMQGMSPVVAGALLAVFGITGILARVFLTPLGARMRDESLLLLVLLILAAFSVWMTSNANECQYWSLWLGSIGMGATAVATNAIAMSMLLRDPGFGAPAVSAGMLSAGFFSGFALGPPVFGVLIHTDMGFDMAWNALVGVLLAGSLICWALHRARGTEVDP